MPPQSQAILQGLSQGDQAAQSMLPNTYQPQGRAKPQNPWQGSLDTVVDQLLSLSNSIRQQGDGFREIAEELVKAAHTVTKQNNAITKFVQEGAEE